MDWVRLETRAFWVIFTATFLLVGWWETRRPFREWRTSTGKRWSMHFLLYLTLPLIQLGWRLGSPVGIALAAEATGSGWFRSWGVPIWSAAIATPVILDFTKYAMHRLFHAVPFLWPLHRVHHSDPDFDVSTSVRFHPVEPMIMQAADIGAILLLGLPPAGVFASGILANLVNTVQHANANLPEAWELRLRSVVMTARVHRIHHSDSWRDEHTNFGEAFPWWDRMFGTYAWTPEHGEKMDVGLRGYQDERSLGLLEMLLQPLKAERKG